MLNSTDPVLEPTFFGFDLLISINKMAAKLLFLVNLFEEAFIILCGSFLLLATFTSKCT